MFASRSLRLAAAGVVVLTLTFGQHAPAPAAAAGDCTVDATMDSEEQAFLVLINSYRAQNGLGSLTASYMLTKASAWKSKDLATNCYFAHDDLSRTWVQRVRDCSYGFNTYLGENIAAGYTTAQSVFDGWKASPGHNANMLGANYTTIGIGRYYLAGSPYGWYWTTDFGGFRDGWATIAGGVTPVAAVAPPPDAHQPAIVQAAQPPPLVRPAAAAEPNRRYRSPREIARGWRLLAEWFRTHGLS